MQDEINRQADVDTFFDELRDEKRPLLRLVGWIDDVGAGLDVEQMLWLSRELAEESIKLADLARDAKRLAESERAK